MEEIGYTRLVTSNMEQKVYRLRDNDVYNTFTNIETKPDKMSFSIYYFQLDDYYCSAKLKDYAYDAKNSDLTARKIINTIELRSNE